MTMSLFLQSLAFNFLTQAVPIGAAVFFGVKYGIRASGYIVGALMPRVEKKTKDE